MLQRIRAAQEKDAGFTLIELLVVMIIIGLLAGIAIPVFLSQKKKAYDTAAKSDLRAVAQEVEAWISDNPNAGADVTRQSASNTFTIGSVSSLGRLNPATTLGGKITASTANPDYCLVAKNSDGNTLYYTPGGGFASSRPAGTTCSTIALT